ncbi:hypothetical protein DB329_10140 [Limosilactobacillus fermentum]|nr:hypothetical protein DB329_10140 [Limosilactobacillus fermentum]
MLVLLWHLPKDGADIILFQFVRGLYKMDILTYLMGQVQQQVLTHHSMVILLSGMTLLVGMVIF